MQGPARTIAGLFNIYSPSGYQSALRMRSLTKPSIFGMELQIGERTTIIQLDEAAIIFENTIAESLAPLDDHRPVH